MSECNTISQLHKFQFLLFYTDPDGCLLYAEV